MMIISFGGQYFPEIMYLMRKRTCSLYGVTLGPTDYELDISERLR
jgi:hypothetical protein